MNEPESLHRAFQDAFNRHDLESIMGLYEPDAVLVRADLWRVAQDRGRRHEVYIPDSGGALA